MKNVVGVLIAAVVLASVNVQTACGLAEFKNAFRDKYITKHKDKAFQTEAKKASCNVCHVKGAKSKKVRNEYGEALAKLIEGDAADRKKKARADGGTAAQNKEKAKLLEELEVAFVKVEKIKSDDGEGPEFGKLIESGKLPVDIAKATKKYKEELAKSGKEESDDDGDDEEDEDDE